MRIKKRGSMAPPKKKTQDTGGGEKGERTMGGFSKNGQKRKKGEKKKGKRGQCAEDGEGVITFGLK